MPLSFENLKWLFSPHMTVLIFKYTLFAAYVENIWLFFLMFLYLQFLNLYTDLLCC